MSNPAALAAALDAVRESAIETILDFDLPKGRWLIQRPDGQFFSAWLSDGTRTFTPRAEQAMACQTQQGAQTLIDIAMGSEAGRKAFKDCKPACVAPLLEAGDHIVCACGQVHEAAFCPTQAGHGMVL